MSIQRMDPFASYQRVIIAFPFTLERTETHFCSVVSEFIILSFIFITAYRIVAGQKAVSNSKKKVHFGNRFYTLDFR